jgi:Tir chaperone family protein CesT
MSSFDTVKQYLLDLRLSIVSEDPAEGLMVVEDEERGLKNLLVDCEEPILVFEQIIMPVPSDPGDMFRRLLQMNRCVVQGGRVPSRSMKKAKGFYIVIRYSWRTSIQMK